MAMEKQNCSFRILMFPWLAHGHISPFLQLSKRLTATKKFTIYLCSTAINLDSFRSIINDDAWIKLVQLHIPPSSDLPPHLHTTKNLPPNLLPALLQAFQMSSSSYMDIMDSVKPDLLIYDVFQPWAPKIASSRGVPSVYFATSGATPFSLYHHIHTVGSASTFPYKAIGVQEDEMNRIKNRIVPNIKDADHDDFAFGIFTRSSDIVLMRSCRAVEEKYIDYLSLLCKKNIVCTGPLIADANGGSDGEEDSAIMEWLGGKSDRSTIYISFGSECFLSREQIAEIAEGLKLCEVNFLWVIRFAAGERTSSIEEELPAGFLERVKGRGLVVSGWAPQRKILGLRSIAGFVSHCGWSSVMESLYFGVPVVTMPMKSEQPINAQLVVESGVGVGVERGGDGVYVGDEVAKAIKKVTVEAAFYDGLRNRTKRLSETMKEKEAEEMNDAAEELWRICMKNKKHV